MTNIMCIECGVKPLKRGAKKYCSKECSLKNTAIQTMYGNFWKGKKISKEVKEKISNSTKGRPSNSGSFKKGNNINTGRKRSDIGEKSSCWKQPIEKICSHCGKTVFLKPNQIRNRKRFFCNRECWALGTRGKGSPVYRGEKAVARYRNRIAQLPEYKEWHAFVMKRDNYKCTITGCTQTRKIPLEVDHIKRFLHIVQENNLVTIEDARNCKELWDTTNGRVVCRVCHRTLDTYGTKGLRKLST